jgi:hypothetical protein
MIITEVSEELIAEICKNGELLFSITIIDGDTRLSVDVPIRRDIINGAKNYVTYGHGRESFDLLFDRYIRPFVEELLENGKAGEQASGKSQD